MSSHVFPFWAPRKNLGSARSKRERVFRVFHAFTITSFPRTTNVDTNDRWITSIGRFRCARAIEDSLCPRLIANGAAFHGKTFSSMVFDFSAIKREKEWLIIARETNDEKASGHGKVTFSKRLQSERGWKEEIPSFALSPFAW